MQLDQVRALAPELARAEKVAPARCQCATATRNVEPVEACEAELPMEELVSLLLETAIGAGNHESVRAVRRPLAVRIAQNVRTEFNGSPSGHIR